MKLLKRKRKVRQRFSRSGKWFFTATVLMFLVAVVTIVNLNYVIFSAFTSVLVVAFLFTRFSCPPMEMRREAPSAVHRGVRFPVTVRLVNRSRFFSATAVRLESERRAGGSEAFIPMIPPGAQAVVRVMEQFARRGVHRLPVLSAISTFPFGIFERRRRLPDSMEITVYPRIRPVRPASIEKARSGGPVAVRAEGEGDEYFSLREYVPGDDLRKVAWRASAKVNTLLVKELAQETSRTVTCVLDNRIEIDEEEADQHFEEAIELAASIAVTLLHRQYTVMVITATDTLGLGEGPSHVVKVLDFFARLNHAPLSSRDPFAHSPLEAGYGFQYLCISPHEEMWGKMVANGARVLHPSEVIHA